VLIQKDGIGLHKRWIHRAQPWLLSEVLRPSDLTAFWRSPHTGVADKVHVSVRLAVRPLFLLRRRERFRETLLRTLAPRMMGLPAEVVPPGGAVPANAHDEGSPGPERARSDRDRLLRVVAEWREQEPAPDFSLSCDESMLAAFAHLVASRGGRLAFFEVPLSTVLRRQERDPCVGLPAWAASRGIPLLRPAFTYTDEDLPDLSHLSPHRATDYAAALARAWAEEERSRSTAERRH
jgi:hypothetical protein